MAESMVDNVELVGRLVGANKMSKNNIVRRSKPMTTLFGRAMTLLSHGLSIFQIPTIHDSIEFRFIFFSKIHSISQVN